MDAGKAGAIPRRCSREERVEKSFFTAFAVNPLKEPVRTINRLSSLQRIAGSAEANRIAPLFSAVATDNLASKKILAGKEREESRLSHIFTE